MAEVAPARGHRGTRAIQRLVEFAPSTGGLALWVQHRDLPSEDAAPAVATDGHTIFYGAAFERLPLRLQAGLVGHEVLHIALRHVPRFVDLQRLLGDVDLRLYNLCADAIVNSALDHLSWLEVPSAAVRLDRLLASALAIEQPVETALLEWDVERLYRAIDDRRAASPRRGRQGDSARGGGGQGSGSGPDKAAAASAAEERPAAGGREDGPRSARARGLDRGDANDLAPGAAAEAPEAEAAQSLAWAERLVRAHAGDGAHSMLRTLIADLPASRTPWEQVLRTVLARSLSSRPDLSWSRPSRSYLANQGRSGPNRRLPWEPGRSASKAVPRLAVIVDVSGSIEDGLLARFAQEIEAITRRLGAGLVLVVGDDRVRRVEHFEPGRSALRDIAFAGGGGTDFTPLLEEADCHRPDIGVVLTDLEGLARFRPAWPVIWAVPDATVSPVAPFGRKLALR